MPRLKTVEIEKRHIQPNGFQRKSHHSALVSISLVLSLLLGNARPLIQQEVSAEELLLLRQAVADDPTSEKLQTDLATALIKLSRYEEGREMIKKALTHLPASVRLRYQLAFAEAQLGNIEAAAESYRRVLELVQDFEPAYVELGNLLISSGDLRGAGDLVTKALHHKSESGPLILLHCRVMLLRHPGQRIPEVETLLTKVIRANPDSITAHLQLAQYHLELEQLEEALPQIETVLKVQPGNDEALYLAGKAQKQRGNHQSATDRFAQAAARLESELGRGDRRPGTFYKLGLSYLELGEANRAIENLSEASRLVPENALFHLALGQAYAMVSRTADSLQHYQRAMSLDPSSYAILYHYGLEMSRAGRSQDAVDIFEKALAIKPNYELLIRMGKELFSLDRRKNGSQYLQQAVALAPDRAEAYYYLGFL